MHKHALCYFFLLYSLLFDHKHLLHEIVLVEETKQVQIMTSGTFAVNTHVYVMFCFAFKCWMQALLCSVMNCICRKVNFCLHLVLYNLWWQMGSCVMTCVQYFLYIHNVWCWMLLNFFVRGFVKLHLGFCSLFYWYKAHQYKWKFGVIYQNEFR